MRKRSLFLLIAVLMVSPLFIAGCSRDDVAIVRIELKNMPQNVSMNSNSLFEKVFRFFASQAHAGMSLGYPTSMQVVLSAPDLVDVSFPVPMSEKNITLELPAGPARRITVYGIESVLKTWAGQVELNLNPGDEIDVDIDMLPFLTVNSFTSTGTISLSWNPVATTPPTVYDVQGYKIYRSTISADGPYTHIGTNTSFTDGSFDDTKVISKSTYYYKVSVYTSNAEGILSDATMKVAQ